MLKVYCLLPHKVTVTGYYYIDLLQKLYVAIKEKGQGKLTQVPVPFLLHDNKPAHKVVRDLKKCVIHHILITWHQVITICFQL